MAVTSDGTGVVHPPKGTDTRGRDRSGQGSAVKTQPLNVGFPGLKSGSKIRKQPGRRAV